MHETNQSLSVIAQTQIQSQIILLQGSVIKLLEEALLTGSLPDINRLYNTSEFAREGSIRALRDQYQRKHNISEYESDRDIKELNRSLPYR
ncbi:hypothetical protein NEMBOFW57_004767 [Staphylotrichum longicolle]|uniref:Uncharacterized protein n=1 Tax=Staphylotrichum longicolle TaxID=669026 RepID=A0AAD4EVU3_9PEZI|nr:hypothetical protein NEMBOFW57_004767 [Staphylotrichum longicolle]